MQKQSENGVSVGKHAIFWDYLTMWTSDARNFDRKLLLHVYAVKRLRERPVSKRLRWHYE